MSLVQVIILVLLVVGGVVALRSRNQLRALSTGVLAALVGLGVVTSIISSGLKLCGATAMDDVIVFIAAS